MKKALLLTSFFFVLFSAAAAVYVRFELREPYPNTGPAGLVEIPRGLRAREVIKLLRERNVIANANVAFAYLFYTRMHDRLQAGEYLFDRPMTISEVLDKLASGAVYLRKFTMPEGLTIDDVAMKWEEQSFGSAADFKAAAVDALDLVQQFDANAKSPEGYLFPETYSFPSRTTAAQAVAAMIRRFGTIIEKLEQTIPPEKWPLGLRDTIVLASLVETEAARAEERAVVASVYLNRLSRRNLLQCDPTVIYALKQAGKYRGLLTLTDLKFPSPYNTYVSPGLPPTPIANPGIAALQAAIQPAATKYLYFVRTADGRHTFSETLAAHNRAVAAYRKAQQAARRITRNPRNE